MSVHARMCGKVRSSEDGGAGQWNMTTRRKDVRRKKEGKVVCRGVKGG